MMSKLCSLSPLTLPRACLGIPHCFLGDASAFYTDSAGASRAARTAETTTNMVIGYRSGVDLLVTSLFFI